MAKLRVHTLAMSLDGFVAGPDQSPDNPLGVRGKELHRFLFVDEVDPVDQRFFDAGTEGVGATIMGRNMFGPVRGDWPDHAWTGWWGAEPPYHHPVFVLTHHARPSLEMAGGTTFHFFTDGIESALRQAVAVAGGLDVRLGGGASTVRQYLAADLVDQLHIAVVPILLGAGERPFAGVADLADRFAADPVVSSPSAAHLVLHRRR